MLSGGHCLDVLGKAVGFPAKDEKSASLAESLHVLGLVLSFVPRTLVATVSIDPAKAIKWSRILVDVMSPGRCTQLGPCVCRRSGERVAAPMMPPGTAQWQHGQHAGGRAAACDGAARRVWRVWQELHRKLAPMYSLSIATCRACSTARRQLPGVAWGAVRPTRAVGGCCT